MTALTERHDAQRSLDRPLTTLAHAGRRITDEREALLHLLDVAAFEVSIGTASQPVQDAVERVREVRG
jgi:hypothetical protein